MGKKSARSDEPDATKEPRRSKLDIGAVLIAAVLILWGASGFVNNRLLLGKGSAKTGFTDGPAWLAAAALICGAAVLLIAALPPVAMKVRPMRNIRWLFILTGWCLLAAALVSQVYLALTKLPTH